MIGDPRLARMKSPPLTAHDRVCLSTVVTMVITSSLYLSEDYKGSYVGVPVNLVTRPALMREEPLVLLFAFVRGPHIAAELWLSGLTVMYDGAFSWLPTCKQSLGHT